MNGGQGTRLCSCGLLLTMSWLPVSKPTPILSKPLQKLCIALSIRSEHPPMPRPEARKQRGCPRLREPLGLGFGVVSPNNA